MHECRIPEDTILLLDFLADRANMLEDLELSFESVLFGNTTAEDRIWEQLKRFRSLKKLTLTFPDVNAWSPLVEVGGCLPLIEELNLLASHPFDFGYEDPELINTFAHYLGESSFTNLLHFELGIDVVELIQLIKDARSLPALKYLKLGPSRQSRMPTLATPGIVYLV
jgi:hypothetical protein